MSEHERSALTTGDKKYLRGLAHRLEVVVQLGQHGLTPGVLAEAEAALDSHQLIKIRLAGDREERSDQANGLQESLRAHRIHQIGHVVVFYRANKDTESLL